ncbi:MAG: SRPBCC family protein [Chitinophagaceae bacterium]|nr:SRPBCC family protein [Chitinophagaceae bacterium]
MPRIELNTNIHAPIQVCFDLSRSAELHMISTRHTRETVVKGRSKGLFEKNDIVTWRAKHFGIYRQLEMEISGMDFPFSFEDRMVKGIFKSITHQHIFSEKDGITTMKDIFVYEEFVPLVERAIHENLSPGAIKKAIKNWQPDNMRV